MPPADGKWVCPLCLVKMTEPGEAARIQHNREEHPEVNSWRGPGPKGRKGAPPPKVGKWRAFNNQDRRGG